ncbi:glycoside hydrolase family 5 protein [Aspergillus affinis]|uniref:glycoside hydrolase family 5 protein n=1 Tax=Aspergillus affinis TaxID=1070780 RepID=UPI0022FE96F7|nr:putative cellulase [Aspergillus affinis]KAI9044785.1 putative cellulase [Aspergillus affinis]
MSSDLQNGETRPMLHTSGPDIVDPQGRRVLLKGAAIAGFLNMENFITGYPGHEHEHRRAMEEVLGKQKAQFFFDRLLHHFFTEDDARYFASLGLNCIRVSFNYRHFIDDKANPGVFKQFGFDLLDRVVGICRKYNLWVILDLHAVPGGQNQDWHYQIIDLWVAIAKHYANDPIIAGCNPLNEPADPCHVGLLQWYDRASTAIREVDLDHILFLDGNTYAMDFSHFDRVIPNAVYSCHDYSTMGFPIPGRPLYSGTSDAKAKLKSQLERKIKFMRDWNVPVRNGEWGPIYPDPRQPGNVQDIVDSRIKLLKEQLSLYAEGQISWNIWLLKDIGYQGMIYVSPDSPYMRLVGDFVSKKQRLGVDFWGCTDKEGVCDVYRPFLDGLKKMVPQHLHGKKYPPTWTFERQVERAVRECLLSEYLKWEYAELFKVKSED